MREKTLSHIELGPLHAALPGAMKLFFDMSGDKIESIKAETGFFHKGLEKIMQNRAWKTLPVFADHVDSECAVFGELALCQAIEDLAAVPVPPRAKSIRMILCELTRVSAHLKYLVNIAQALESEALMHFVLRDREKVLDLFELLSGMRFSINFLNVGGVRADITEGFLERVLDLCETLRHRLKEYNDLCTYHQVFLQRARGVGILSADTCKSFGISGPNARAAGIALDIRRAKPYLGYERVDFKVQTLSDGDAHSRLLIRIYEIEQSLHILKQECERISLGSYCSLPLEQDLSVPPGEGYSRVESSRGLMSCHVISEGNDHPARVHFRVPSSAVLSGLSEVFRGEGFEDFPMILSSLDIGLQEVDR